jgi:phosphate acetyltransferase
MSRKHEKYERLLALCKGLRPARTAVAHPCDETSLRGAVEAARMGILLPILVGPRARIEAVAKQHGLDIRPFEIVDTPHSHASAEAAARLAGEGKAEMLMKGACTPTS